MSLRNILSIIIMIVFVALIGAQFINRPKSSGNKELLPSSESSLTIKKEASPLLEDDNISLKEKVILFIKQHRLLFGISVVSFLVVIAIIFTTIYFNRI